MNNMDQNADILPKLSCQYIGANKGTIAIDNKIPINGIVENNDKFSPKLPVEAETELNSIEINNQNLVHFDGIVSGKISDKPLGSQGFHYDPIFIPNGTNKTFAQMSAEEKNKISHRAIALKKMKRFILNLID